MTRETRKRVAQREEAQQETETYLVIFHDSLELDHSNECEDLEVFLNFFIRCPQEELHKVT